MKILFTKIGIEKEVSEKLGKDFACDFADFIKIKFKQIEKLNLENSSLIFTSKNAVKGFLFNDLKFKKEQKIYCVGNKTKTLVEENGGEVLLCEKNAEKLAQEMLKINAEKYCHFSGDLTLNTLENSLKNYYKIEVYKTELLHPKLEEKYDTVVFFSPSSVCSFAKNNSFENLHIFSIGKTTSGKLKNFTENTIFTSKENNLDDLLVKIKNF